MNIPYYPLPILLDSEPRVLETKKFHGLTICIENPKGSIRQGKGWSHKMNDDYGFIKGYVGADSDDVDCYLGNSPDSKEVYVVDQGIMNNPEKFDEHKVMLGYPTVNDAKYHYIINHSSGARIFQNITPMTISVFKAWLERGNLNEPVQLR